MTIVIKDLGLVKGFSIIDISYSALLALYNAGTMVPGFYNITNRADLGIVVQAITSSKLSLEATGSYYVADYNLIGSKSSFNLGVWNSSLVGITPISSIVIWNGLHYSAKTFAVGTAPDSDNVNWGVLSKSLSNGYLLESDILIYDFKNDKIISRRDKRGNTVNFYSLNSFQFGNNNYSGQNVLGAIVELNSINQRGTSNSNVFHSGLIIINNSYVDGSIYNCEFNTGNDHFLTLNTDGIVSDCRFNYLDSDFGITPSINYSNMDFPISNSFIMKDNNTPSHKWKVTMNLSGMFDTQDLGIA